MIRGSLGVKLAFVVVALGSTPALAQSLPVVIPPVTDPRFSGLTIPANAPTQGMWSASFAWPLIGLHLSVLPDGQILSYGTPLGQSVQDGRTFDRWNPLTANVAQGHTTIGNSANVDSFCAAGILQTGGAMLVSGGDSNASAGNLSKNSTVFNYTVNTATTQSSALAQNRWYGSFIKLADGRTLMTGGGLPYVVNAYQNPSGNLNNVSMTPEVWNPATATWSSLTGISVSNGGRDAFGPDFNRWWYPRNWVAPNGQVFGISAEKMWFLNPAGSGSITFVANFKTGYSEATRPNIGPTSTAVMYDVGKILQVGGNGAKDGHATTSSEFATTIDINSGTPVVTETAAMANRRQWPSATVLPNGRVVVTGGTRFANNGGADAVFAAESWNPATGTWSNLASAAIVRVYHSATALLPNGTILSTGGGAPGPVNNLNGEIFYPPYLFVANGGQAQLATRPQMISASARRFAYGSTFQIEMSSTQTIGSVAILGISSTTHSFDMGQRFIPATFSQAGAILTINAPANANIAPPGYYQVVANDLNGVPSRGFIVSFGNALPAADLIAHYPMNQTSGTSVPDASGNGKTGTLVGGGTWVAGTLGNAVRLSGASQYVDLPDNLVQGCTDFTFAGWVNLAASQNWARIFDFGSGTATNMFMTARAGGATLRFAIKNAGGAEQQISYGTTLPLNQWRHVAVVLSGNTGRLYLSGIQVAQNTNLVLNPINMGATPNVWLGRSQYAADPYLNGTLDDVRMSCRAYSAEEIAALAAM
jgi:galactose oxidase